MNIRKITILPIIMLVVLVSSCISSEQDNIQYYDDAAIQSASLGTMSYLKHTTTKAGKDSTYYVSYAGSAYKLYVDHEKGEIYNVDSLKKDTKTKMIVNLVALNSGYIYLKDKTKDEWTSYNASDSIDFSQPRVIRVVANNGTHYKTYNIRVNIHNQAEDEFLWHKMTESADLEALADKQMMYAGSKMYVVGTVSGTKKMFSSTDGKSWTLEGSYDAATSFLVKNDAVVTVVGDNKVFAANDKEMYAVNGMSIVRSADGGASWLTESLEGAETNIPAENICGLTLDSKIYTDVKTMILMGNCAGDNDKARVWSKTMDYADASVQPWVCFNETVGNNKMAPRFSAVAKYYQGILLLNAAHSALYYSRDMALTWSADSRFMLPEDFDKSASSYAMMADKDGYLWIIADGKVWKGYLTQALWTAK